MMILYFFVFIFGTIIGSFLNVVIDRWNTGKTLGGRSKCDVTGKTLAWYELIPILSFLMQGGKSRHTGTKLSLQYPLVEVSTGLVFVLVFQKFWPVIFSAPANFMYAMFFYFFIFSILIAILVYDFKHKIIPDWFVWEFNILALLNVFIFFPSLGNIIAGPLVALPLFFLWFISGGKWLGFGDVKFALGMGWLLGISTGFAALLLSFWIGAIVGVGILLYYKKKNHQIPFAPFLILATFITFLYNIDMESISYFFGIFI